MKQRPKNLNLFTIRLPINAVVSIMHRASGMALYLMIPVTLGLLSLSLQSQDGFEQAMSYLDHWAVKVLMLLVAWAFFHHLYAGLRHLAHDLHWLHGLQQAKNSSKLLLVLDGLSVLALACWVW